MFIFFNETNGRELGGQEAIKFMGNVVLILRNTTTENTTAANMNRESIETPTHKKRSSLISSTESLWFEAEPVTTSVTLRSFHHYF